MQNRQEILDSLPSYLVGYASQVPEGDISTLLDKQIGEVLIFFNEMAPEKLGYRYAEGKWTPREILHHMSDSERVFQYRALRFARNDKTDLPGFEENDYVRESNADSRELQDLLNEFISIRSATVTLLNSLSDEALARTGTANGARASTLGLFYCCAGHIVHHLKVIRERYL
jgi:hypothetical protein